MAEGELRRSPLHQLSVGAGGEKPTRDAAIEFTERRFLGKINLRGDPADIGFMGGAEEVLGFSLPTEPNRTAEKGDVLALWLGPDEWLVVTQPERDTALAQALRSRLTAPLAAITVVSDQSIVIAARGAKAREVLAKVCPLDLDPRVFGPGRCARTRLARVHVIVHPRDEQPTFDLYVDSSLAEYLWLRLEDAGREYGDVAAG